MTDFYRTYHLHLDVEPWKQLIADHQDQFVNPFDNTGSYLNIYADSQCDVQFFNLQHCDYSRQPSREGTTYIKYLMAIERRQGNTSRYDFLKANLDRFCVETNEENFVIPHEDPLVKKLVKSLNDMWAFDASNRHQGVIARARIVKLPAGGIMPYHRDETSDANIRVICPIITNTEVFNAFRENGEERLHSLPASGHFYSFDETKIEHAVFNRSAHDRYALIFTVVGVSDLKQWDREYYKNKLFWENWGRAS